MHNGYAWLRENLLPYSYGLAVYEHETGMPMMRPLSMELPGKPEVDGMDWLRCFQRGGVSDRGKVIPAVKKSRIGMQLAGENNPCGTKERNRDESGRPK